jgi:hypothetical protein
LSTVTLYTWVALWSLDASASTLSFRHWISSVLRLDIGVWNSRSLLLIEFNSLIPPCTESHHTLCRPLLSLTESFATILNAQYQSFHQLAVMPPCISNRKRHRDLLSVSLIPKRSTPCIDSLYNTPHSSIFRLQQNHTHPRHKRNKQIQASLEHTNRAGMRRETRHTSIARPTT